MIAVRTSIIISLHDDHNIVDDGDSYLFCVMCVNVLVFVLCVTIAVRTVRVLLYCVVDDHNIVSLTTALGFVFVLCDVRQRTCIIQLLVCSYIPH